MNYKIRAAFKKLKIYTIEIWEKISYNNYCMISIVDEMDFLLASKGQAVKYLAFYFAGW